MLSIANAIAERGYEVHLLLARAEGPYLDRVSSKVKVVDFVASRMAWVLPKLVVYLRRTRPTVLLSALPHTNLIALWARRLAGTGTRLVISERTFTSVAATRSPMRRVRWLPLLMKLFYPWADGVIAVSKAVADDLSVLTHLDRARIAVIYNPVDLPTIESRSSQPPANSWFSAGADPVVLAVGRLEPAKDFDTLIRAFEKVRQKQVVKLIILGEGKERNNLQHLVNSLGLSEAVALPGYVENPYGYMAHSALFVSSSRWEGLPNVLIEALACGCPIIATNAPGGSAELLDNGRYGRLVPVGDPVVMSQAMLEELNTNRANNHLSRNRQWLEQFALDYITDRYLELLQVHA